MTLSTTADYDVAEAWVQIGPRSWVPAHFRVTRSSYGLRPKVPNIVVIVDVLVVDPSMAAGVTLYDEAWPTPVAKTVAVTRTYGEVLAKDLRDVPVVQLVEDGAAALLRPDLDGDLPGTALERGGHEIRRVDAPASSSAAARELRQAREPLHRPKIDLRFVAHAYQEAQKAGRRDTNVAVGERIGLSRSRAADYVRQARLAGFLPPVPPPRERRGSG